MILQVIQKTYTFALKFTNNQDEGTETVPSLFYRFYGNGGQDTGDG